MHLFKYVLMLVSLDFLSNLFVPQVWTTESSMCIAGLEPGAGGARAGRLSIVSAHEEPNVHRRDRFINQMPI